MITTIVVPFYNEAATLRRALERLLAVEFPGELQVVLVDDGSDDEGASTITEMVDGERVILLRTEHGGKGSAVRAGIEAASGNVLGILDADLEYDPADLVPLVEEVLSGRAVVAYGTRALGRGTRYSRTYVAGNRITSLWASFLFGTRLTDIHTCLKVAPLDVWRSLGLSRSGFDLDSEATARFLRSGYTIVEVPVSYAARSREEGKKLYWTDGLRTIEVLTRIRLSRQARRTPVYAASGWKTLMEGTSRQPLDESPPSHS